MASLLLLAAACGGSTAVDPIGPANPSGGDPSAEPGKGPDTSAPVLPIGPYTGLVGVTDVSILYPLPTSGGAKSFIQPTEGGPHGALFPQAFSEIVMGPIGSLEKTTSEHPSTYAELRLVSVRLDHCAVRGGPGCKSEVRVVFQALYEKAAGAEGDPSSGTAATDGGVHVTYDVPEAELVTMMKEILTLKKANGDLATIDLRPHPILAEQGLGGAFAEGLRTILLHHLGAGRIARVTIFDHNFNPDSDGWQFEMFDRAGDTLVAKNVPFVSSSGQLLAGSHALTPLADSSAEDFSAASTPDPVRALVAANRPAKGTPESAALYVAWQAALRVQNPTLHDTETTDCVNCHLAEGARRIGDQVYAFKESTPGNEFRPARATARADQRTSVTNLHAFSYLHRAPSIMLRTMHESIVVADAMEARVK
ncbi:MAG: hypothetical protein KF819_32280 [Labilithrix sp.]|nr:hypothetical protein [Labilithrix sp.]